RRLPVDPYLARRDAPGPTFADIAVDIDARMVRPEIGVGQEIDAPRRAFEVLCELEMHGRQMVAHAIDRRISGNPDQFPGDVRPALRDASGQVQRSVGCETGRHLTETRAIGVDNEAGDERAQRLAMARLFGAEGALRQMRSSVHPVFSSSRLPV